MEKDITYYQQLATDFYRAHFAEIKEKKDRENAEMDKYLKEELEKEEPEYEEHYHRRVLVYTWNDTCIFPTPHAAATPRDLMFGCSMRDGEVRTVLRDDGKDKVAEALGLVDIYDHNERIEVDYVRKEDGYLHLDLPERLQGFPEKFYRIKLLGLDDFVNECSYTGWGDSGVNNVLEVLGGIVHEDCIDFEKTEIYDSQGWYVGPGDTEGENYYAQFDFSHCEIAKDSEDDRGWAVYVCYEYLGLVEQ